MPLSALMTFLFTNISPLTCLWSDMLCQHDGVVPNDFMTNFAFMTNHTQKNSATSQPGDSRGVTKYHSNQYVRCWKQWRTDWLGYVVCPLGTYEKVFW